MKRRTLTGFLAAAALVVGATGAAAATAGDMFATASTASTASSSADADCCGGLKGTIEDLIEDLEMNDPGVQGPEVRHDVNTWAHFDPRTGASYSADAYVGVCESDDPEGDCQVQVDGVEVGRTGVEVEESEAVPSTDVSLTEGTIVEEQQVLRENTVCGPFIGCNDEVTVGVTGQAGVSVFDKGGSDAVSGYGNGAEVSVDPGNVCVHSAGDCQEDSGGTDRYANVQSPDVTVNQN